MHKQYICLVLGPSKEMGESILIIEVVMASLEVGSSHAKMDVAFSGWVWLIVESGNILCLRKLLRANSSVAEVKNDRVEAFACESFYLLLLFFYLLSCFYLLLLSSFSCAQSYLPGNNILHIFILHAQVIKMDVTPSSHN